MTLEKYIRLIVIAGAYALLRPYILKLAGEQQTKEHEKGIDVKDMPSPVAGFPKSLRDQAQVPEDSMRKKLRARIRVRRRGGGRDRWSERS
jgi:Protein trafficking PGA2